MPSLPLNPYIVGPALRERGFWGRDDVFGFVKFVLSQPDQHAVVLSGQRRIGKTSILQNLQRRLPSDQFVCVYFDLMNQARKPLGEVLHVLAHTIADELSIAAPGREAFDNSGSGLRTHLLPAAYAACGERRLVLLLDEFDVLDTLAEEQLPPESAARAFFPFLRDLMAAEPRLGFVFVIGRKTSDLGIETKAAFKSAQSRRISVLDEADACRLIETAQRHGSLRFAPGVTDRVLALTAGHPFFVQLLCQLIFERAYADDAASAGAGSQPPLVTPADVDAVVPRALETGENIFEWIWDGLPPAERVIFSAVAQGTDEHSVMGEDALMDILQRSGVRILVRELEIAPRTLVDWEMLRQTPAGYCFFVELLRRWVVLRKPLSRAKDELDRINPLADVLFQGASGFFRAGQLESAQGQLQQALRINPNHVKARLMLGDLLGRQGELDGMVRELGEAWRIDPDSARYAYENALLARAAAHERAGESVQALLDYKEAMKVSPGNAVAREGAAAASSRIDAVLDARYTRAATAFTAQRWDEAVATLREVVAERPGYRDAEAMLARAGAEANTATSKRRAMLMGALLLAVLLLAGLALWRSQRATTGGGLAGAVIPGQVGVFSPETGTLAVGTDGAGVQLWDSDSGQFSFTITSTDASLTSFAVAFSRDGNQLAFGGDDTLAVADLATRKVRVTKTGHGTWVHAIAWSPDDAMIATGSHDNAIRLWRSSDLAPEGVITTTGVHTSPVGTLSFFASSGGELLFSASGEGPVVWNVVKRELAYRFPTDAAAMALDEVGGYMVAGGYQGIKIFSQATGGGLVSQTIDKTLADHYVFPVAVSRDRTSTIVASGNGSTSDTGATVDIWRLNSGGKLTHIRTIAIGDASPSALSFNRDATLLAVAIDRSSKVRVFEVGAK